jgi:PPK2 family polyphosphate:nucleotide phosphotransferase
MATPKRRDIGQLLERFRITDGRRFRLKQIDTGDTGGFESKDEPADLLRESAARVGELQEKLYAQDTWAVLIIFQAMDAAGKDGTIKHVLSDVDPQGCEVFPFKAPSSEELAHDFLWRTTARLPERGRIGVFNRSYYEEVLVVRVHGELLAVQQLPPALVSRRLWKERFEDITAFERHMTRSGTVILKFFLHVSKKEQRKRFLARIDDSSKNWKFSLRDVTERGRWSDYMRAYEDMIRHTATPFAPWYVIPADYKWFTRLMVASAVVEALDGLKLSYPRLDAAGRKEVAAARRLLARG